MTSLSVSLDYNKTVTGKTLHCRSYLNSYRVTLNIWAVFSVSASYSKSCFNAHKTPEKYIPTLNLFVDWFFLFKQSFSHPYHPSEIFFDHLFHPVLVFGMGLGEWSESQTAGSAKQLNRTLLLGDPRGLTRRSEKLWYVCFGPNEASAAVW